MYTDIYRNMGKGENFMKLDFNLNLSQQQKLVMTQNMQLSINILQMSSLELNEFINKQIEEKRKQKNKFYLLDVDGNSGKKDFFDKHWVYDSNTKNIRILCELKQQMKDD